MWPIVLFWWCLERLKHFFSSLAMYKDILLAETFFFEGGRVSPLKPLIRTAYAYRVPPVCINQESGHHHAAGARTTK